MFNVDTFRLIRKTFKRFMSLVCIVFVGVSFMMGLFSTSAIMRESVDRYNDRNELYDIQLYSSYGFCEEDIEEIRKTECVEEAFPSKTRDVYCMYGDYDKLVARVRELDSDVNGYEIIEGRKPSNRYECLIVKGSYSEMIPLGSELKIYSVDDNLKDYLNTDTFTVVGYVDSPEYMCNFLSSSNLNNLDLDLIIFAENYIFVSEYYTTVYMTLKEGASLESFSDEYKDFITEKKDEVESLANRQEGYLKATIIEEYEKEIEDGERELEENRLKGQKELDDAKQELDDANVMLLAGQMEIDSNKATLEASKKTLDENKTLLDSESPKVYDAVKKVESSDSEGRSFDEIYQITSGTYGMYQALKASKGQNTSGMFDDRITELRNENAAQQAIYDNALAARNALDPTDPNYLADYAAYTVQMENAQQAINNNNQIITTLENTQSGGLDTTIDQAIQAIDDNAGGSIENTYRDLTLLKQAKDRIDSAYKEIESGYKQLEDGQKKLDDAQKELNANKRKYEDGLREYKQGLLDFNREIEDAEIKLRKARQDLEELPDAGWMILDRDSHYTSYMYKNTCSQMGAIGIVMPMLFYAVAALVCMTTMTRLIDEQRGQIGIFRALGFSNAAITGKYLLYALLASLIGSVAGVPVGMAVFPTVIYTTWRLMYRLPDMTKMLPLSTLAICILAFSSLMMLVSFLVLRKTLKEMPSQLMRPKAPKNAKKVFLEYIPVLWNKISFTSKITARNLIRYKSRFFMTVIGIAGCAGLLVLGFGIKDSIGDVVNIQFGHIMDYDYTVSLEDDYDYDKVMDALGSDLDNEALIPMTSYLSKVYYDGGDDVINAIVLNGREASMIFRLEDKSDGSELRVSNSGVIISEKFAINNKLKKGDTVTIESKSGLKAQVKISGICKMYFQHYMFISDTLYDSLFKESLKYTSIAIVNKGDSAKLYEICENTEGIGSLTDFSNLTSQFNTMIEALDLIIAVIVLTAGALAFVVLINLTQVNISEREREIATLKVLGFRNLEVDSYIFKEIALLSVIGGILGMPLGLLELKFVMNVINMEMIMFPTDIKILSYLISFAITMVFTFIVLMFTKKPLREIKMVESLKSVE